MQFYNVELKGTFLLEKRISSPAYQSADEGRLFYYTDDVYLADSTSQVKIWSERNVSELRSALASDGVWTIAQGGTNADNVSDARINLGLTGTSNATHAHDQYYYTETESDTKYGQLTSLNTWTQQNRYNGACTCFQASHDSYLVRVCNSYSAGTVGRGLYVASCGDAICTCSKSGNGVEAYSQFSYAVYGCSLGCYGVFGCSVNGGTYAGVRGESNDGRGVYGYSIDCYGVYACATGTGAVGLYARSPFGTGICGVSSLGVGICGYTNAALPGVCGFSGSTNGVSSNNGYTTTSSKYLKYLDSVCLSNCLKERPLTVYKYYWEDSNSHGFSEAIGPTSEDFNKTFNIDHLYYGDDYLPLVNVDGAALGLGIENLNEIEKLKEIVTQLYGCIQKLEEKE